MLSCIPFCLGAYVASPHCLHRCSLDVLNSLFLEANVSSHLSLFLRKFQESFQGKLDSKLLEAVKEYESIDQTLTSVLTYIMLATDTQVRVQGRICIGSD